MTKRTKYGEATVLISIRVPQSKKDEISDRFYSILSEYSVLGLKSTFDREFESEPVKSDVSTIATRIGVGLHEIVPEDDKKATASGDDKKTVAEVSFERIDSLPQWTQQVKSYGAKGSLRTLDEKEYYTKRTHGGKLEILKHKDLASALLYCEENFK